MKQWGKLCRIYKVSEDRWTQINQFSLLVQMKEFITPLPTFRLMNGRHSMTYTGLLGTSISQKLFQNAVEDLSEDRDWIKHWPRKKSLGKTHSIRPLRAIIMYVLCALYYSYLISSVLCHLIRFNIGMPFERTWTDSVLTSQTVWLMFDNSLVTKRDVQLSSMSYAAYVVNFMRITKSSPKSVFLSLRSVNIPSSSRRLPISINLLFLQTGKVTLPCTLEL